MVLSWTCPKCGAGHETKNEFIEVRYGARYVHCGVCGHDWALPVPQAAQQATMQPGYTLDVAARSCPTYVHNDAFLHLCAHRNGCHQVYNCAHWVARVHVTDGEYVLRETAQRTIDNLMRALQLATRSNDAAQKRIDDLVAQGQADKRLADLVRELPEGYVLHHEGCGLWSTVKTDAIQGRRFPSMSTPEQALLMQGCDGKQETADAKERHDTWPPHAGKGLVDLMRALPEGMMLHHVRQNGQWRVEDIVRGVMTEMFTTPEEALMQEQEIRKGREKHDA